MQELKLEGNDLTAGQADDTVQLMSFEAGPLFQWPTRLYGEDETGHTCCPDCGSRMVRLGSCFSCPSCGYQSCGG